MRKLRFSFFIHTLIFAVLFSAVILKPAFLYAAGCLHHEPDRDGDGVADEKDPYPDDPTRWSDADRFPSMRITYIPSSESVEGDVDEFNIEEKSPVVIWVFENKAIFDSVRKLIDKQSSGEALGDLDSTALRLKVEFPKDQTTFYMDKAGVVAKDEEVVGALTQDELKVLEKTILSLRGIVDLKENQNLCQELPVEQENPDTAGLGINGKPVLNIAMIPFTSPETGPVAVTDISDKAQITIAIFQNSEIVTNVRSVLQGEGSGASVESESIRFQAEFPSDSMSIVVDKAGATSQNGQPKTTLSAEDLKFLEEQVQALKGVVDMRIQEKLCQAAV